MMLESLFSTFLKLLHLSIINLKPPKINKDYSKERISKARITAKYQGDPSSYWGYAIYLAEISISAEKSI